MERGLAQEKVARALGVSQKTMSDWELGNKLPHKSNRMALARFYEKPEEWLFEEDLAYVTTDV